MKSKLKAKLLIGILVVSRLFSQASNISAMYSSDPSSECETESDASDHEFESASATAGVGNGERSTLTDEPTGLAINIPHVVDPVFNTLQRDFSTAVEHGDVAAINNCLAQAQEYGVLYTPQLNWLDHNWTLLHVAAIKSNATDILRALFFNNTLVANSARSLINAQDSYGRTPLHWAARNHNYTAYIFLTSQGANRTILDNRGRSPADYFARPIRPQETFNDYD